MATQGIRSLTGSYGRKGMRSSTTSASGMDRRPASLHPGDRASVLAAMWIFIASEMPFFGGLMLAYAVARYTWPEGFTQASLHTSAHIGVASTAILITCSGLMAAATASRSEVSMHSAALRRLFGLTAVLGMLFLAAKGIEYRQAWLDGLLPGPGFELVRGRSPPAGAELFFTSYFATTVLHSLHLVIGVCAALWFAWDLGRPGSRSAAPGKIEALALYWHFVCGIWVLLYPLFYLVGRGA